MTAGAPRPLPDPREFYVSGLIVWMLVFAAIGGGVAWLATRRWGAK